MARPNVEAQELIVNARTTGWHVAVTTTLMAAAAACANQSSGLSGAAMPQGIEATTAPADASLAPVAAGADVAAAGAVTDALAAEPAAAGKPAEGPVAALVAVDAEFVDKLLPAMASLGTGQSPALLPHTTAYAADGTMSVALAAAVGVDALRPIDLERGATVGYVYLVVADRPRWPLPTIAPPRPKPFGADPEATPAPAGVDADAAAPDAAAAAAPLPTARCCVGNGLRSGAYSMRVVNKLTGAHQGKIQAQAYRVELVDNNGRVLDSLAATVTEAPDVAAAPWAAVTLDRGGPLTLSVRSGRWRVDASRVIP